MSRRRSGGARPGAGSGSPTLSLSWEFLGGHRELIPNHKAGGACSCLRPSPVPRFRRIAFRRDGWAWPPHVRSGGFSRGTDLSSGSRLQRLCLPACAYLRAGGLAGWRRFKAEGGRLSTSHGRIGGNLAGLVERRVLILSAAPASRSLPRPSLPSFFVFFFSLGPLAFSLPLASARWPSTTFIPWQTWAFPLWCLVFALTSHVIGACVFLICKACKYNSMRMKIISNVLARSILLFHIWLLNSISECNRQIATSNYYVKIKHNK